MTVKHALVRLLNRRVLPRWRLALRKSGQDGDDYPLTEKLQRIVIEDICRLLLPFLSTETGLLPDGDGDRLQQMVRQFFALYRERPVRDNTGGSGFNGSLSLYLLARLLAPRQIVESGTWQGHSAWVLTRACPQATIDTFDIEHDNLLYRDPQVRYRLGDWSDGDVIAGEPEHALAFFDDHVSHARRLREAHGRGFRTLILDDNVPAQALYATGDPPAPTIDMLFDPRLKPGEVVEWTYRGRTKRFHCDPEDWDARALVRSWHKAPSLSEADFYRPHRGLTLVRLAP